MSNLIHEQAARILYGDDIFAFGSRLEEDWAQFLSNLGKKSPHVSLVIFRSCSSILGVGFLFSFSGRRTSFGHIDSLESRSDEAIVVFLLDLKMYMLKIA